MRIMNTKNTLNALKYAMSSKMIKRLLLLITIGAVLIIFSLIFGFRNENRLQKISKGKKCFQFQSETAPKIDFLKDVLKSYKEPEQNKCIFFLLTSCSTNGIVELNAREACAIESAAKWNPNRDIFVLFTSLVGFVHNESLPLVIQALQSYPNVHFRTVNIYSYAENTPAEQWIKNDTIFLSSHLSEHMSDYLRFLTLYKFGGIYLDLDFVIQQNLDKLPANFVGAESRKKMYSAVLGINSSDIGHNIAEMMVRENTVNFQPDLWGFNGPDVVTRVVHRICFETNTDDLYKPKNCWGFKIYPPNAFYAIPWDRWANILSKNPEVVHKELAAVKGSFAVHTWNDITKNYKIVKSEPKTVYEILAEKNCPNVFSASGLYF